MVNIFVFSSISGYTESTELKLNKYCQLIFNIEFLSYKRSVCTTDPLTNNLLLYFGNKMLILNVYCFEKDSLHRYNTLAYSET